MSLLLVRHGQASAGSDDYDRLSSRGQEQSARLGRWLADTGHAFDAVVVEGTQLLKFSQADWDRVLAKPSNTAW